MPQADRTILPSMNLQAMLCKITETFARELAQPTLLAPQWSDFEWTIARAVVAMHGVSPLLARILRWRGPVEWEEFLKQQRAHTAKRHGRIDDLLRRIDQRAREAGITVLALKGAALHAMGVYSVGDRPMADIDLLVRPADAESTCRLLESLGFYESAQSWKERVFTPFNDHIHGELGENSDNNVKIELHDRICERLPWRITDASELIFPTHPRPGLNSYASEASLMIHLLLHAAGAMTVRALRLLQLQDLALVSSRMTDRDWDEMLRLNSHGQRLWWAFPPLILTSRYYSPRIPGHVLTALAANCPFALKRALGRRTLHDFSCSYLWVEALPGVEWAQSVGDMLEYAVNRMRPSAGHIALRERLANTQASADRSQWTRLSQGRRILRWISSPQARPLTMHSVYAAFAKPQ